ncbi:CPBP family intramembrane glutamic endopeptidase [Streptomyces yaizuensis]|uniref:CPBP family intramembrane metalloprotease n=1 Tax=Streptomyces yaizuensis TaxID=2989713 RepID=A0AA86JGF8_9ACTN|nr:CPBP family intramembrane glutamic endopeptidase [Streptomyces sp. YSPA8]BDT39559.1 CPBP family intramembrane metalloprotease [Streptomyces sp. YSPA8]
MNGRPLPGRHEPRRAYRDALGLIAVAAGPTLYRSTLVFSTTLGATPPPVMTGFLSHAITLLAGVAGGWWLSQRVEARLARDTRRQARLHTLVLTLVLAHTVDSVVPAHGGVSTRLPAAILMAWLTWEIIRARGISADAFETPLGHSPRWAPAWLAAALALAAFVATGRLATGLDGYGPTTPGSQLVLLGLGDTPHPLLLTARIVWTSVVEELVVTAAVITLLRQARRPVWEWTLLVVAVRVLGHGYLGTPALAQIVIGLVAVLLYVRCRGLVPLIAIHILYDLEPSVPVAAIAAILALAIHAVYRAATTPAPDDPGDGTTATPDPTAKTHRSLR